MKLENYKLAGVDFSRDAYPGMNDENVRLWETYCNLRDVVIAKHHGFLTQGKRTPKNIWLFVVGRDPMRRFSPPEFIYPKRCKAWLQQAIRRCESALEHPDSV